MAVTLNASTSTGLVQTADTSGEIELQSNGTTALKVNTNEGIQILNCLGVGNATPSTSGAGITFPATQSASSDANTLDDYEEGTFTPTFETASAQPANLTYVNRGGNYTKIGRYVIAWFYMNITVTSAGTGNPGIKTNSLPFAPASNNLTNSASSRGGFVTSIPNANGAGAILTFNNSNPSSADILYMTNNTTGGSMTAGAANGVYAGYVMYEA